MRGSRANLRAPRLGAAGAPQSTREHLMSTGYDLFYRFGFHGVGVDQIIKKVGISKATFYNHFESKDALIVAVLRWRDALSGERIRTKLRERAGSSAHDQILAVFDILDDLWGGDGYRGCLFARAVAEFPVTHDPVHVVAVEAAGVVRATLRELVGYSGAKEPEKLAMEMLMIAAGGFALSQFYDPRAMAGSAKDLAACVLDACLPRQRHGRR